MIFFLIFVQNIDCGYTLERGGSNEYPQSIFWSKHKKKRCSPAYPSFCYIKVGLNGVYVSWTCFADDWPLCGNLCGSWPSCWTFIYVRT